MSDLEEMFAVLESCCLHDPQWRPADVDKVICWYGDRENGPESHSIVIVRLNVPNSQRASQGQHDYGLLTQQEDYTGHGCQCDSMTVRESMVATLLGHLDNYELLDLLGDHS